MPPHPPAHHAPYGASPAPPGYPPPGYGEAYPPGYGDPPYGDPPYGDPPYGDPGYGDPGYGAPYDSAVTEVFDRGLLTTDPYADAHTTQIPVSPPVEGPRGFPPGPGYGAPPRPFEPPPSFGAPPFEPPSNGFGPPPDEFGAPAPAAEREAPLFSRFRRIRSHAKRRRSRGWMVAVFVLFVLVVAAGARFWPGSPWYAGEGADSLTSEPMPFRSVEITVDSLGTQGFLSWAYTDLNTGDVVGSANMAEPTETGPMIAAWFGADLLRRSAEGGQAPADAALADIEAMIMEEDVAAAERVVANLDGVGDSITRLGTMCHLNDLMPGDGSWQNTAMSAEDAALLGGCIADGRAAGAEWTPWLLNVMRQVHSDFGLREAFPPDDQAMIAVANGVTLNEADGHWRANCLAITQDWSLAVLQRYPASDDPAGDRAHVDAMCRQVVWRLTGTQ